MTLDEELRIAEEENRREVAFIKKQLPSELKEKFSDDELYYFLDVIIEYYTTSGVFDAQPDKDGYVDIDLDEVVKYVLKKAKKEKMGDYEHDDILFVVQGELEYSESLEEE